jgi:hypothetical protein
VALGGAQIDAGAEGRQSAPITPARAFINQNSGCRLFSQKLPDRSGFDLRRSHRASFSRRVPEGVVPDLILAAETEDFNPQAAGTLARHSDRFATSAQPII